MAVYAALIPSCAADRVYRKLILQRKVIKQVQRGRLHMSGGAGHALVCQAAILESEVETHVLCLDSDRPAEIYAAARDAVVRSTGKFADIAQGAAESPTNIEIVAIKSLRGSHGKSEPTKGKQEQFPLTQSSSPVSSSCALLDDPNFFDAANRLEDKTHRAPDFSCVGLKNAV